MDPSVADVRIEVDFLSVAVAGFAAGSLFVVAAGKVCVDTITLATEKGGTDTPVFVITEVPSVVMIAGDETNRFFPVTTGVAPGFPVFMNRDAEILVSVVAGV